MGDLDRFKTGPVEEKDSASKIEAKKADEEKLLDPSRLKRELAGVIERYSEVRDDDGSLLTPITTIVIGGEDEGEQQAYIVQAAYIDNELAKIYQIDPITGNRLNWITFLGVVNTSISNGEGDALESIDDRKIIKSILEAMQEQYTSAVVEQADGFDIKAYLIDKLRREIAAKKDEIEALQAQQATVEKLEDSFGVFRVTINDAWAKEGGKSLDEDIAASSISEAVRIAAERFKELNRRSDIQASGYAVCVYVNGQKQLIPGQVTAPLFKSLSR